MCPAGEREVRAPEWSPTTAHPLSWSTGEENTGPPTSTLQYYPISLLLSDELLSVGQIRVNNKLDWSGGIQWCLGTLQP